MRAYSIPQFGADGAVSQRAIPEPGEGEILVRVHAAGVNAMDPFYGTGRYQSFMEHRLPITPGNDYAGTVEALGPGVEGLAIGDEVFGDVGKAYAGEGTFAEYTTASAALAAHRPAELPAEKAAALPRTGGTALAALDALDARPGDTIVVIGAAGGVGNFVTQLAARSGIDVIAVTKGENADFVRRLGASEVIDYTAGDVVEQVRALRPDGVAGVMDNFHDAAGLLPFASIVRPGGRIVSPLAMGAEQAFEGQPVNAKVVSAAPDRAGELGELAARGELDVPVEMFALEDAAQALDKQASRQVPGKLVILIG
jgi:NADPH:quinone reductase-like Zn-dependent oxidoreductase